MLQDDSVVKFNDHKDSVFCISNVPKEPYNMFISGDCNDKAILWSILKEEIKDGDEIEGQEHKEEEKK